MTGDLFKARFVDCHFDESVYPTLGENISRWENRKIGTHHLYLIWILEQTNVSKKFKE